jgi:hypothetical protein
MTSEASRDQAIDLSDPGTTARVRGPVETPSKG